MLESLSPTKQTTATSSVYRYYAGFPNAFVDSLLDHLGVESNAVVLDPWNGAGTTTEVCSARGISSIGIDLNPFMRVVAQVRCSPRAQIRRDVVALQNALGRSRSDSMVSSPQTVAANLLRRLEDAGSIERDSALAIFAFASATRAIYRSVLTRNPTWFSMRRSNAVLSTEQEIKGHVILELNRLQDWAKATLEPEMPRVEPYLITGDAANAWVGKRVDHIISSPPYLTRIDYALKTLPELLFIDELFGLDVDNLRKSMLGSVLTGREQASKFRPTAPTAQAVISAIEAHESKASTTYYLKFFLTYFEKLGSTLDRTLRLLTKCGTVNLVTQGSYYKEIYIDLPRIVSEMMIERGFVEYERTGFRTANHMAAINTRTFASRQLPPEEIVSGFRREK